MNRLIHSPAASLETSLDATAPPRRTAAVRDAVPTTHIIYQPCTIHHALSLRLLLSSGGNLPSRFDHVNQFSGKNRSLPVWKLQPLFCLDSPAATPHTWLGPAAMRSGRGPLLKPLDPDNP